MFEIFVQYFNLTKYIIQTNCFITPTTSDTLVLINYSMLGYSKLGQLCKFKLLVSMSESSKLGKLCKLKILVSMLGYVN